MKKKIVSILAVVMSVLLVMTALVACAPEYKEYDGTEVQGVSETADGKTKVVVGNTAATSGAFAGVGVPFNYALEAYLWHYSTNVNTNYVFDFKHYDDEFTAEKGLTYTKQLVEQDKVFALVGHFGTNTIEATADYIKETGVPMAYAATGVSALYNTDAQGYARAIMPVQPIYNTEGRSLVATAVAPTEGGMGLGAKKLGVISTTDDAGISILAGVKEEVKILGIKGVTYQAVDAATGTDYSAAVNALKGKGCDVVIIAANQGPFAAIAAQFVASNYDNVGILTSYVSSNAGTMAGLVKAGVMTETRKVYAGSWLDIIDAEGLLGFHQDYWNFTTILSAYGVASETVATATDYLANSYAMAGYIAGVFFCEGLDRVQKAGDDLTWLSYIEAMESKGIILPMTKGIEIGLADGQRIGIPALSLAEYKEGPEDDDGNKTAPSTTLRGLTDLADLEKAYNDAK